MRHFARRQLLLKFFLRVGRFQFREFRLDVRVGRHQTQLLGALQHDFVVHQGAQHFQFLDHHLIVARAFAGRHELRLKLLVQVGVRDHASVHSGRDIFRNGVPASEQG